MKRITLLVIVLYIALSAQSQDTTRPWTFWYWMYGAVSKPGIKADLQAMKDVGLGGCYLMPIRGVQEKPEYQGEAQQLTPQFWEMIDYAFQQADSLGLQMGIHVCDGFALAGGPWITPEESMQKVVWSDTVVSLPPTPSQEEIPLPQAPAGYQGYYEDIAAFAIRLDDDVKDYSLTKSFADCTITHSESVTRNDNGVYRASTPGYIQFNFDEAQTIRSVEIVPSGNNVQSQRFLVPSPPT